MIIFLIIVTLQTKTYLLYRLKYSNDIPSNFEQKIGFDQIRQLLKTKCLSTLGEERVESMDFSDSYDEINRRLEQVTEFVRIIQEEDDFPSQYFLMYAHHSNVSV